MVIHQVFHSGPLVETWTEDKSVSADHQEELPKKVWTSKVKLESSKKVQTESKVVTKPQADSQLLVKTKYKKTMSKTKKDTATEDLPLALRKAKTEPNA